MAPPVSIADVGVFEAEDGVAQREPAQGLDRADAADAAHDVGDALDDLAAGVLVGLRLPLAQHEVIANGEAAVVAAQLEALLAGEDGLEELGPGLELMDHDAASSRTS